MNRKRLAMTIIALFMISGCAQTSTDNASETATNQTNQTHQDSLASWVTDKMIQFNKSAYTGSDVKVEAADIQEQVGTIEYSSDDESDSEHDNFSNYYPVGTKLYKIKEYSTKDAIAIETGKDTFVLATTLADFFD